jgi:hypothetical protein
MPGQSPLPYDKINSSNSNSDSTSADSAAAATTATTTATAAVSVPVPVVTTQPVPHLPGTVRLSVLNGTSGIFIAKIRKKRKEEPLAL